LNRHRRNDGNTSCYERRNRVFRHWRNHSLGWHKIPSGGGETVVDGTSFGIDFSRTVTITITGDGGGGRELTSVTIDGVKYIRTATVEALTGTEIVCYAANGGWEYGAIYLNGTVVARGSSHGGASYTYTAKSDMEIKIQTDMRFTGKIYLTTK